MQRLQEVVVAVRFPVASPCPDPSARPGAVASVVVEEACVSRYLQATFFSLGWPEPPR